MIRLWNAAHVARATEFLMQAQSRTVFATDTGPEPEDGAPRTHCGRPIDIGLIFSAPRGGTKPIGAIKLPAQTGVVATSRHNGDH